MPLPGPHAVRVDAARARLRARLFGRAEEAPRVGRFVILRQLGAGAMGTVFAAYDESLERKVAVKMLSSPTEQSSRARLLREAKSMARLRHPNIVQIYEVGEHDSDLYIAMEFVDGQSLRTWQSERRRSWMALVDAYVQAGHGLAAAHAVGIIHRDFKPDNVMVEVDASGAVGVRVLDFGLARSSFAERSSVDPRACTWDESIPTVDVSLTRTGKAVGTPAYMAPEQIRGLAAGPPADQFALCVALWEALYGEHPFASDTVDELFERVTSGRRGPARNPRVPRRVTMALERGLDPDPDARWPSVTALAEALSATMAPRSSRTAVALVGLAVAALVGATVVRPDTPDERCAGAQAQLAGIWDEARAGALERSMLASELPYADAAWTHTRTELQTYADDWKAMYTEACEATSVRGEQSAEVMAQRMRCLHRAKAGLQAATNVLAEADANVVEHASRIVSGLDPLPRCADLDALADAVQPPPTGEAETVAEVEALLARSRTEAAAGRYPHAQTLAMLASRRAVELSYEPLRTELAWTRAVSYDVPDIRGGHVHHDLEPSLREALRLALASGDEGIAHRAATRLIALIGGQWGRPEEGLRYREIAEAFVHDDPRREALTRGALAAVLRQQGQTEAALDELRAAAALVEGTEPMLRLELQRQSASLLLRLPRADEAEGLLREMLETQGARLGPDHPSLTALHRLLALALSWQGRNPEAEVIYREALASFVRALGPDHANVSMTRVELAAVLAELGKSREAEEQLRRVLALHERRLVAADPASAEVLRLIAEGRYGEADALDHELVGSHDHAIRTEYRTLSATRQNLAVALQKRGEFARAEVESRHARALAKRAAEGTESLASAGHRIGSLLSAQGRHADAVREHRATQTMVQRELGPEHPLVATARTHVGGALMRQGHWARAVAEYRSALASRLATQWLPELRSRLDAYFFGASSAGTSVGFAAQRNPMP